MDVSEILESVKSAISAAWERALFLVRTYRGAAILILLILCTGIFFWARSGFSLQIGKFFAADVAVTTSTGPGAAISPCNRLVGNGKMLANWKPQIIPIDPLKAPLPPCTPFSAINASLFPSFSLLSFDPITELRAIPTPPIPVPLDWAKCLVVLDRRSENPSFRSMVTQGVTVPTILQQNPNGKLYYKALVINNCPWTVHMSLQVDGQADVSTEVGVGKRKTIISLGEILRGFRHDPASIGDFPSCWNTDALFRPVTCGKEVTIEYDLNTYTCGSVGVTLKWWHLTNNNTPGEYTADDPALKREINGVINYGSVCTGSPAERQPGKLGAFPVDPTGACVWREQFNAPNGAWFCNDLQCGLGGNNTDAPTLQREAPVGPASRLGTKVMGEGPEAVDPANGPIHIRTKLDATPKGAGGKEGYPAKDPLWSCTAAPGVMDLGRNGHDFYDCYNPIIHRYNYGPITCCANTGLSEDCFTWDRQPGAFGSVTPAPGTSPNPCFDNCMATIAPGNGTYCAAYCANPSPSSSAQPGQVSCAPTMQTVELNAVARLQASGGDGTYQWNIGGGALVEDSGNAIGVKFGVSGTKSIGISSKGTNATCTVSVVAPAVTNPPATSVSPSISTSPGNSVAPIPTTTGGYVTPVVSSGVTITPAPGTTDTDGDGVADSVECRDANRCPDSNGDGRADWQDPAVGNRVGRVLSASEIQTGPGEVTLLALIISALVSLLYVSYTHSPLAVRREAEDISKDQGPLDFRS